MSTGAQKKPRADRLRSNHGLRLIALAVCVASCMLGDSWVIVRKDGSRIQTDGPFLVVSGVYTFRGPDGLPGSVPAEEVDAQRTAAANSLGAGNSNTPAPAVNRSEATRPGRGDFLVTFRPPFPAPPGPNWTAFGVHPPQERFSVHVPNSYTGREPFGVMVYIDSEEQNEGVPAGWSEILEQKKLLFVAAQASGDPQHVFRRLGLALLGALEMKELYNVDPARVYAAGFSGGARIANELAFYDPSLIHGTIQNSGAEFYERVPKVRATNMLDTLGNPYGHSMVKVPPERMAVVKKNLRFAMITGSRDFRRGNILDIYYGGYVAHGFHARLFDIDGMEHDTCDGATLRAAIEFLEAR